MASGAEVVSLFVHGNVSGILGALQKVEGKVHDVDRVGQQWAKHFEKAADAQKRALNYNLRALKSLEKTTHSATAAAKQHAIEQKRVQNAYDANVRELTRMEQGMREFITTIDLSKRHNQEMVKDMVAGTTKAKTALEQQHQALDSLVTAQRTLQTVQKEHNELLAKGTVEVKELTASEERLNAAQREALTRQREYNTSLSLFRREVAATEGIVTRYSQKVGVASSATGRWTRSLHSGLNKANTAANVLIGYLTSIAFLAQQASQTFIDWGMNVEKMKGISNMNASQASTFLASGELLGIEPNVMITSYRYAMKNTATALSNYRKSEMRIEWQREKEAAREKLMNFNIQQGLQRTQMSLTKKQMQLAIQQENKYWAIKKLGLDKQTAAARMGITLAKYEATEQRALKGGIYTSYAQYLKGTQARETKLQTIAESKRAYLESAKLSDIMRTFNWDRTMAKIAQSAAKGLLTWQQAQQKAQMQTQSNEMKRWAFSEFQRIAEEQRQYNYSPDVLALMKLGILRPGMQKKEMPTPEEITNRLIDVLPQLEGGERMKVMQKFFGRGAGQAIRYYMSSAKERDQLATMAKQAGVVVTEKDQTNWKKTYLQIQQIKLTWKGVQLAMVKAFMPLVQWILPRMLKLTESVREHAGVWKWATAAVAGFVVVVKGLFLLKKAFEWGSWAKAGITSMLGLQKGVSGVAAGLQGATTAGAAAFGPAGWAVLGVGAAITAFTLLYTKVGWFHDAVNKAASAVGKFFGIIKEKQPPPIHIPIDVVPAKSLGEMKAKIPGFQQLAKEIKQKYHIEANADDKRFINKLHDLALQKGRIVITVETSQALKTVTKVLDAVKETERANRLFAEQQRVAGLVRGFVGGAGGLTKPSDVLAGLYQTQGYQRQKQYDLGPGRVPVATVKRVETGVSPERQKQIREELYAAASDPEYLNKLPAQEALLIDALLQTISRNKNWPWILAKWVGEQAGIEAELLQQEEAGIGRGAAPQERRGTRHRGYGVTEKDWYSAPGKGMKQYNQVGYDVTKGVAVGMASREAIKAVTNAAKTVSDQTLAAMKRHLGETHSPSEITKEFGRDLAKGLAIGIGEGEEAIEATRKLLSGVLKAGEFFRDKLPGVMSEGWEKILIIFKNSTDSIIGYMANMIRAINDAFEQLGIAPLSIPKVNTQYRGATGPIAERGRPTGDDSTGGLSFLTDLQNMAGLKWPETPKVGGIFDSVSKELSKRIKAAVNAVLLSYGYGTGGELPTGRIDDSLSGISALLRGDIATILNRFSFLSVSALKEGHDKYVNGTNRVSEHWYGRAADFTMPNAVGNEKLDAVYNWLKQSVKAGNPLRIRQLIHDHEYYTEGLGFQRYGPSDHRNHIHMSVLDMKVPGTLTKSMRQGQLFDDTLKAFIRYGSVARNVDPKASLAVASVEGGFRGAVGDHGSSFGPFQLHRGGALPSWVGNKGNNFAKKWANAPEGVDYALNAIQRVAAGLRKLASITAIVTKFERPADPHGEIDRAWARYPKMAEGGFVEKPTVALIGEAGPEFVFNKDQMRGLKKMFGSVPSQIAVDDSRLSKTIGKEMKKALVEVFGRFNGLKPTNYHDRGVDLTGSPEEMERTFHHFAKRGRHYDVTAVAYNGRAWSKQRPFVHAVESDSTAAKHMDHVHVEFGEKKEGKEKLVAGPKPKTGMFTSEFSTSSSTSSATSRHRALSRYVAGSLPQRTQMSNWSSAYAAQHPYPSGTGPSAPAPVLPWVPIGDILAKYKPPKFRPEDLPKFAIKPEDWSQNAATQLQLYQARELHRMGNEMAKWDSRVEAAHKAGTLSDKDYREFKSNEALFAKREKGARDLAKLLNMQRAQERARKEFFRNYHPDVVSKIQSAKGDIREALYQKETTAARRGHMGKWAGVNVPSNVNPYEFIGFNPGQPQLGLGRPTPFGLRQAYGADYNVSGVRGALQSVLRLGQGYMGIQQLMGELGNISLVGLKMLLYDVPKSVITGAPMPDYAYTGLASGEFAEAGNIYFDRGSKKAKAMTFFGQNLIPGLTGFAGAGRGLLPEDLLFYQLQGALGAGRGALLRRGGKYAAAELLAKRAARYGIGKPLKYGVGYPLGYGAMGISRGLGMGARAARWGAGTLEESLLRLRYAKLAPAMARFSMTTPEETGESFIKRVLSRIHPRNTGDIISEFVQSPGMNPEIGTDAFANLPFTKQAAIMKAQTNLKGVSWTRRMWMKLRGPQFKPHQFGKRSSLGDTAFDWADQGNVARVWMRPEDYLAKEYEAWGGTDAGREFWQTLFSEPEKQKRRWGIMTGIRQGYQGISNNPLLRMVFGSELDTPGLGFVKRSRMMGKGDVGFEDEFAKAFGPTGSQEWPTTTAYDVAQQSGRHRVITAQWLGLDRVPVDVAVPGMTREEILAHMVDMGLENLGAPGLKSRLKQPFLHFLNAYWRDLPFSKGWGKTLKTAATKAYNWQNEKPVQVYRNFMETMRSKGILARPAVSAYDEVTWNYRGWKKKYKALQAATPWHYEKTPRQYFKAMVGNRLRYLEERTGEAMRANVPLTNKMRYPSLFFQYTKTGKAIAKKAKAPYERLKEILGPAFRPEQRDIWGRWHYESRTYPMGSSGLHKSLTLDEWLAAREQGSSFLRELKTQNPEDYEREMAKLTEKYYTNLSQWLNYPAYKGDLAKATDMPYKVRVSNWAARNPLDLTNPETFKEAPLGWRVGAKVSDAWDWLRQLESVRRGRYYLNSMFGGTGSASVFKKFITKQKLFWRAPAFYRDQANFQKLSEFVAADSRLQYLPRETARRMHLERIEEYMATGTNTVPFRVRNQYGYRHLFVPRSIRRQFRWRPPGWNRGVPIPEWQPGMQAGSSFDFLPSRIRNDIEQTWQGGNPERSLTNVLYSRNPEKTYNAMVAHYGPNVFRGMSLEEILSLGPKVEEWRQNWFIPQVRSRFGDTVDLWRGHNYRQWYRVSSGDKRVYRPVMGWSRSRATARDFMSEERGKVVGGEVDANRLLWMEMEGDTAFPNEAEALVLRGRHGTPPLPDYEKQWWDSPLGKLALPFAVGARGAVRATKTVAGWAKGAPSRAYDWMRRYWADYAMGWKGEPYGSSELQKYYSGKYMSKFDMDFYNATDIPKPPGVPDGSVYWSDYFMDRPKMPRMLRTPLRGIQALGRGIKRAFNYPFEKLAALPKFSETPLYDTIRQYISEPAQTRRMWVDIEDFLGRQHEAFGSLTADQVMTAEAEYRRGVRLTRSARRMASGEPVDYPYMAMAPSAYHGDWEGFKGVSSEVLAKGGRHRALNMWQQGHKWMPLDLALWSRASRNFWTGVDEKAGLEAAKNADALWEVRSSAIPMDTWEFSRVADYMASQGLTVRENAPGSLATAFTRPFRKLARNVASMRVGTWRERISSKLFGSMGRAYGDPVLQEAMSLHGKGSGGGIVPDKNLLGLMLRDEYDKASDTISMWYPYQQYGNKMGVRLAAFSEKEAKRLAGGSGVRMQRIPLSHVVGRITGTDYVAWDLGVKRGIFDRLGRMAQMSLPARLYREAKGWIGDKFAPALEESEARFSVGTTGGRPRFGLMDRLMDLIGGRKYTAEQIQAMIPEVETAVGQLPKRMRRGDVGDVLNAMTLFDLQQRAVAEAGGYPLPLLNFVKKRGAATSKGQKYLSQDLKKLSALVEAYTDPGSNVFVNLANPLWKSRDWLTGTVAGQSQTKTLWHEFEHAMQVRMGIAFHPATRDVEEAIAEQFGEQMEVSFRRKGIFDPQDLKGIFDSFIPERDFLKKIADADRAANFGGFRFSTTLPERAQPFTPEHLLDSALRGDKERKLKGFEGPDSLIDVPSLLGLVDAVQSGSVKTSLLKPFGLTGVDNAKANLLDRVGIITDPRWFDIIKRFEKISLKTGIGWEHTANFWRETGMPAGFDMKELQGDLLPWNPDIPMSYYPTAHAIQQAAERHLELPPYLDASYYRGITLAQYAAGQTPQRGTLQSVVSRWYGAPFETRRNKAGDPLDAILALSTQPNVGGKTQTGHLITIFDAMKDYESPRLWTPDQIRSTELELVRRGLIRSPRGGIATGLQFPPTYSNVPPEFFSQGGYRFSMTQGGPKTNPMGSFREALARAIPSWMRRPKWNPTVDVTDIKNRSLGDVTARMYRWPETSAAAEDAAKNYFVPGEIADVPLLSNVLRAANQTPAGINEAAMLQIDPLAYLAVQHRAWGGAARSGGGRRSWQEAFARKPEAYLSRMAPQKAQLAAGEPLEPPYMTFSPTGELLKQGGRHRAVNSLQLGLDRMPLVGMIEGEGQWTPAFRQAIAESLGITDLTGQKPQGFFSWLKRRAKYGWFSREVGGGMGPGSAFERYRRSPLGDQTGVRFSTTGQSHPMPRLAPSAFEQRIMRSPDIASLYNEWGTWRPARQPFALPQGGSWEPAGKWIPTQKGMQVSYKPGQMFPSLYGSRSRAVMREPNKALMRFSITSPDYNPQNNRFWEAWKMVSRNAPQAGGGYRELRGAAMQLEDASHAFNVEPGNEGIYVGLLKSLAPNENSGFARAGLEEFGQLLDLHGREGSIFASAFSAMHGQRGAPTSVLQEFYQSLGYLYHPEGYQVRDVGWPSAVTLKLPGGARGQWDDARRYIAAKAAERMTQFPLTIAATNPEAVKPVYMTAHHYLNVLGRGMEDSPEYLRAAPLYTGHSVKEKAIYEYAQMIREGKALDAPALVVDQRTAQMRGSGMHRAFAAIEALHSDFAPLPVDLVLTKNLLTGQGPKGTGDWAKMGDQFISDYLGLDVLPRRVQADYWQTMPPPKNAPGTFDRFYNEQVLRAPQMQLRFSTSLPPTKPYRDGYGQVPLDFHERHSGHHMVGDFFHGLESITSGPRQKLHAAYGQIGHGIHSVISRIFGGDSQKGGISRDVLGLTAAVAAAVAGMGYLAYKREDEVFPERPQKPGLQIGEPYPEQFANNYRVAPFMPFTNLKDARAWGGQWGITEPELRGGYESRGPLTVSEWNTLAYQLNKLPPSAMNTIPGGLYLYRGHVPGMSDINTGTYYHDEGGTIDLGILEHLSYLPRITNNAWSTSWPAPWALDTEYLKEGRTHNVPLHEFGHAFDFAKGESQSISGSKAFWNLYGKYGKMYTEYPSSRPSEFFAEAFQMYYDTAKTRATLPKDLRLFMESVAGVNAWNPGPHHLQYKQFETGGWTTGPTLSFLGEKGKTEAVLNETHLRNLFKLLSGNYQPRVDTRVVKAEPRHEAPKKEYHVHVSITMQGVIADNEHAVDRLADKVGRRIGSKVEQQLRSMP